MDRPVWLTTTLPSAWRDASDPLHRQHVGRCLRLPNYTNNLRRLGYDDHDFADGGSQHLVTALVASGEAKIRARTRQHLDADCSLRVATGGTDRAR